MPSSDSHSGRLMPGCPTVLYHLPDQQWAFAMTDETADHRDSASTDDTNGASGNRPTHISIEVATQLSAIQPRQTGNERRQRLGSGIPVHRLIVGQRTIEPTWAGRGGGEHRQQRCRQGTVVAAQPGRLGIALLKQQPGFPGQVRLERKDHRLIGGNGPWRGRGRRGGFR